MKYAYLTTMSLYRDLDFIEKMNELGLAGWKLANIHESFIGEFLVTMERPQDPPVRSFRSRLSGLWF